MSDQEKQAKFLAKTRVGYLSLLKETGAPVTVPVWYDWDGEAVKVFTGKSSPKVRRLKQDPRATLVVGNDVGEPEGWVAFDGEIVVSEEDVSELITTLAHRYWDMSNPETKAVIDGWLADIEHFVLLTLTPGRVRSYLS